MLIIFINYSFSIEDSLQSDLRISTAGKHIESIRVKHVKTFQDGNIFYIIDQIERFKSSVVNQELSSLHGESLEITLTIFLVNHVRFDARFFF